MVKMYIPLVIVLVSISLQLIAVQCVQFDVGGNKGWVTPPAKDDQFYNDWASRNRFKANDTLRFKYDRDSVMEVTQEEYDKCRSSHPIYFANNGETLITLDRPGLFYFISGVSGHCQRGLKMIVKVLELDSPPQVSNQTSSSSGNPNLLVDASKSIIAIFVVVTSFFGVI